MQIENLIKLNTLIPKFMEKMFHGDNVQWSQQVLRNIKTDVEYFPPKPYRPLTEKDLQKHFEQRPYHYNGGVRGGLAITGDFNGLAKWFCLDCDNEHDTHIALSQLIPIFKKFNIDYIYEHSGENNERAHIWFMCDPIDIDKLKLYVDYLFDEAGIDYNDSTKYKFELFPTKSRGNRLRIPGGYHCRNKKANPITYNNKTSSDPAFIMESFINCIPISNIDINKVLATIKPKKIIRQEKQGTRRYSTKSSHFLYKERNLTLSPKKEFDKLPTKLKKVVSNCQAIQSVIQDCIDSKMIEERGGVHHTAGLYLNGLALYNDLRSHKDTDEGINWIDQFSKDFRFRPEDSHNWKKDKSDVSNPERLFPSCKTWERDFDKCKGCPFYNREDMKNPKQFIYGKPIEKTLVSEMNLTTIDDVRNTVFKEVEERILYLSEDRNRQADILLATFQESGKSYTTDSLAVALANRGKRVLISVPTGELALQHKKTIESMGQKAFVVMSHLNTFGHQSKKKKKIRLADFDCPDFENIQFAIDLGVSSTVYKKRYCKGCPFANQCPYPKQYKKVKNRDDMIVIIQHAHFTTRETLYAIVNSGFDALFIDESFINDILVNIKPTQPEIEGLKHFSDTIQWIPRLLDWFSMSGYPIGKIDADENDLMSIKNYFDGKLIPYKLGEYIKLFNQKEYFDKNLGILIFYPIPEKDKIPIRVLTDATPPEKLLKLILNTNKIEVYGSGFVSDFTALNPENKVYQVLDGSMSKTALSKNSHEKFYDYLQMIGDKIRKDHKDEKVLITVYQDWELMTKNWLMENYPDIMSTGNIDISHMSIGTNAWKDYTIQFLICGVYLNGKQYYDMVYKINYIRNYWNRITGRNLIHNPYPLNIGESATIPREESFVKKIEKIDDKKCGIFEYSQFIYRKPKYIIDQIVEDYAIAKTQQAIRLRFKDSDKGLRRMVYVLGNYFLPNFLITDTVLEDDLLGEIRKQY